MKTIAICNLKGGVAKTTTTVNLAANLARDHGRRVLVIDADSQANTTAFYKGYLTAEKSFADLLRTPKEKRTDHEARFSVEMQAIQGSNFHNVDLLPADNTLMDLDLSKVESEAVYTGVLAFALPYMKSAYDYVLIDCPPAFNAASTAALLAADEVLIPIKLDAFALEGMANLMQQIHNMRRINPTLRVLGLLPVMWYKSEQIARAEAALRESGLPILPRIRRSNRVDDMTFAQQPLIVCSPKSGACQDYRRLAERIDREVESNG